MKRIIASLLLLSGCGASAEGDAATGSDNALSQTAPRLPTVGNTPWGGADASRWRPEAMIANATSQALNVAWSSTGTIDAVVAVPVKMLASDFFEYGDGQANAAPSFEWWRGQSRPPLVATLIRKKDAQSRVLFTFDRALPYSGATFEVRYGTQLVSLQATRTSEGDAVIDWPLPPDLAFDSLLSSQSALIHPVGWSDWFPVWFRMPVKDAKDLRVSQTRFSDGRPILDREGIGSVPDSRTPFERLQSHAFTAPYNNGHRGSVAPYLPNGIHATFPFQRQLFVTGVGRGWTWVADEYPGGFKTMYTCFERRNAASEARAANGGVASGGGWHQINDAAETIVNDLEKEPIVVASAQANVWLESHLPSGTFSYGLTDVVTVRWLHPGEAFITTKGKWVDDGRGRWFDQANYHWYFFHQDREVCTEELISPKGQVPYDFAL